MKKHVSPWKRANTDWFLRAKWGVFAHYIIHTNDHRGRPLTAEAWSRQVDRFDVNGLARQLAQARAPYFFITIGQNSGHFCAPNRTYDEFVGIHPSKCSRRDLSIDLADALKQVGIRLMVYLPSAAPCGDRRAVLRLRCTPPWDAGKLGFPPKACFPKEGRRTDPRMSEFQRNWEAIIREWSLRWGRKVHGWWIDGCYTPDEMYRHPDEPNFRSFAAAMKAGNPDALVAFNPGVKNPVISMTEHEDYTAGEISNTLPTNGQEPCVIPVGRWVNGAQYHLLSFLGGSWGAGQPRFPDEMAAAYTRYVNSWQGVMTWDVPSDRRGLIRPEFFKQLRAIGKAVSQK